MDQLNDLQIDDSVARFLDRVISSKVDKMLPDELTVYKAKVSKIDNTGTVWGTVIGGSPEPAPITSLETVVKPGDVIDVVIDKGVMSGKSGSGSTKNVSVEYLSAVLNALVTGSKESYEILGSFDDLSASRAIIGDLEASNAKISGLTAETAEIDKARIRSLKAVNADIDQLSTGKADIDFANIISSQTANAIIQNLLTHSGWFTTAQVGQQQVGYLTAVHIDADDVEIEHLKVRDLYLFDDSQGTEGIWYQLNITAGGVTYSDLTPEMQAEVKAGLHGSNIVAGTVTADKIVVQDLSAFNATIAGMVFGSFQLAGQTYYTMHTFGKTAVNSDAPGIYVDQMGQVALGEGSNHIILYKDANNRWKIDISASSISLGSTDLASRLDTMQGQIDNVVETWFGEEPPYPGQSSVPNEPYTDWTTAAERNRHLGDVYYDNNTGIGYRFSPSTVEGQYTWVEIPDSAVVAALQGIEGAVMSVVVEYANGTSTSSHSDILDSAWGDSMPAREDGKYVWQRTTTVYGDSTVVKSYACIQGATGAQGPQGATGATGPQGETGPAGEPVVVTASASGRSVTTPDASELPLLALSVDGESVQDGTPSPSSPQPIRCVRGRNLLDISSASWDGYAVANMSVSGGKITYSAIAASGMQFAFDANGKYSPGQYVISLKASDANNVRRFIRLRKPDDSGWMSSSDTAFTTGWAYNSVYGGWFKDGGADFAVNIPTCLYWEFGIGYTSEATAPATIEDIQLESGSTASPYVPYGCIGVHTRGKNLLPIPSWDDIHAMPTSNGYYIYPLELEPNTTYHLKTTWTDSALAKQCGYILVSNNRSNSVWVAVAHTSSGSGDSNITTGSDGLLYFNVAATRSQYDLMLANAQPQLEKGTTATSYEPYRESVAYIDLQGNELHALDSTYRDVLTVDASGHAVIEKRCGVLFGDFSATNYSALGDGTSSFKVAEAGASSFALSNVATLGSSDMSARMAYSGLDLYMRLSSELVGSTAASANTYLNSNGVKVVYPLATPQTIDLGYVTLPAPFDGGTVEVVAEVTPEIDATWWTEAGYDTGLAYSRKLKAIASTEVSYQLGASGTVPPSGTWSDAPSAPTTSQYLWTRTVTTYTDGDSDTAYSVGGPKGEQGIQGATGATGAKGDTGAAGEDGKMLYGTCTATNAGSSPKVVDCSEITELYTGLLIAVKFTYANTVAGSGLGLNVNSLGSKPIFTHDGTQVGSSYGDGNYMFWAAGAVIKFMYDASLGTAGGWRVADLPASYFVSNSTAATTVYKDALVSQAVVQRGTQVTVTFANIHNNTTGATLSITSASSNARRTIYRNGSTINSSLANSWAANSSVTMVFDGKYWQVTDGSNYKMAEDAAKGASDFIFKTTGNDAWVCDKNCGPNPSTGEAYGPKEQESDPTPTTGWRFGNIFEMVREGISWFKLWVDNNTAKIRLGLLSGGHTVLDDTGMEVFAGTNGADSVAKFGTTTRIGRDRVADSICVGIGEDPAGGFAEGFFVQRWESAYSASALLTALHDEDNGNDYVYIGSVNGTFPGFGYYSLSVGHFGPGTGALGYCSIAVGRNATAGGNYGQAFGFGVIASSDYQAAFGKYNIEDANDDYVFIVGNGTGDDDRSNAMAVARNGDVRIGGHVKDMSGNRLYADSWASDSATASATLVPAYAEAISGGISLVKRGKMVMMTGDVKFLGNSGRVKVATIPSGFRPALPAYVHFNDNADQYLIVNTNGDVQVNGTMSANTSRWFSGTWLI